MASAVLIAALFDTEFVHIRVGMAAAPFFLCLLLLLAGEVDCCKLCDVAVAYSSWVPVGFQLGAA